MKKIIITMLLMLSLSINATTIVNLESPVNAEPYSGIGLISGWAVSDIGIDRVEFWKDGIYHSIIPYGGTRGDVEKAYPGYPNSLHSGFGMKWAYSLFGEGNHTIAVKIYDIHGNITTKSSTIQVVGFPGFVRKGEIEDEIFLEDVNVQGNKENITLQWRQASQQYEIVDVANASTLPEGITHQDYYETRILNSVNEMRSRTVVCGSTAYNPAAPVKWNDNMAEAAMNHSIDMGVNDFFSHTGSNGSTFVTRLYNAGYIGTPMGEVIGAGASTPEQVVNMWEDSPGHCSIIMNQDVTEIGHGMVTAKPSQWGNYWTMTLGR